MADFALTYDDYVQSHPGDATGGSEGGQGTSSLLSPDQWNNMSDTQKWDQVGNGIVLTPSDPRYADLAKQLGVTNGRQIVGGPTDQSIPLDSANFVDPGRVVNQGRNFFTSDENLTPRAQEQGGVADWFWPVAFLAGVAGGALAGGAGAGTAGAIPGASSALETGGIVTSGDIAAGTSAGLSTAGTAGAEGAVAGAAPGAASSAEAPPPVDESAGLNMTPSGASPPPVDESAGLNMNPGGTPGAQAPAPVSEAPPPVGTQAPVPVTDISTPAPSGIINDASNGWQSISNWYSHLSPASRYILGLGVSQGARGALGAVSQHEAHQAAVDAENRHRQDVIRQGQVPVLPPGTFTYKPPGG